MNLAIVNDVLQPKLLQEIRRWVEKGEISLTRCNLDSWPMNVVKLSGAILLRDILGGRKLQLLEALAEFLPVDVSPDAVTITHTYMGRLAYIPWHEDTGYRFSMTLYLNERWERDWAGHLIVEEPEGLRAILPKFNSAVMFEPPVHHMVAMPSLDAPLRESLQIFVKEAAP